MLRRLRLLLVLASLPALLAAAPAPLHIEVPQQMDFCGMRLTFTAGARQQIQGYVNSLLRYPEGYARLVQRGATFLPHMADAFRHIGTPEDLVYITLQESALQGDAISSSHAVGYWQFKEPTAKAMGLVVDGSIDERKHITRSSMAAAKYLRYNYDQTGNWFYAVVAYMTGPTGALPYVKENYRYARNMRITEEDHWYALKVLAHILAFREAIANATPEITLEAKSVGSERSLWQLLERERLARITWAPYNLWAQAMRLGTDRPMTHFVPHKGSLPHVKDPHLALFTPPAPWQPAPEQTPVVEDTPTPITEADAVDTLVGSQNSVSATTSEATSETRLRLTDEPYYRVAFTFLAEEQTLAQFCTANGLNFKQLRSYNRHLDTRQPLRPGMRVFLQDPRTMPVHICLPGETLPQVAGLYRLSVEELLVRNHLSGRTATLAAGQKLYLHARKPPGEGTVCYHLPFED